MNNVTFQFVPTGSLLKGSCFPDDEKYYIPCRLCRNRGEEEPLPHPPLSDRTTCCFFSRIPSTISLELMVDRENTRVIIDIKKLARQCNVSQKLMYHAYEEGRFLPLLEKIGRPLQLLSQWSGRLQSVGLSREQADSIATYLLEWFRKWQKECADGKCLSILCPPSRRRRYEIEYFADRSIYVVIQSNALQLAFDLHGEDSLQTLRICKPAAESIYRQLCSKPFRGSPGILTVYRVSTVYRYSPRIYHKQYQTTLLEAMRVLTEPDKLQVARDLIQGLSTLHENRIVNKALSDLEHYLINIDRQSQTIEAVIGHFDSSEVLRSTHDNTSPLICHPYAQDVLDLGCILDRLFSTHWSYSHTPQEPRIQDLIQKMTHRDPQSRITAQQANQEFQDILKTL